MTPVTALPTDSSESTDEWLLSSGIKSESVRALIEGGYDTMDLFVVCTQEDIDEIGKEFNLSTNEKLKLKCAVNTLLENKTEKLQIIDSEEGHAMLAMQGKIKLFSESITSIGNVYKQINEEHKSCERLLNETFDKIEHRLKERRKELSQKVLRMMHIKHKILAMQSEATERDYCKAKQIKQECDRCVGKGRKAFILSKEREMKEMDCASPKVSPYLSFDFDCKYQYLLHTISAFGEIGNPKKTILTANTCILTDEWDQQICGDNIKCSPTVICCNEVQSYCYRSAFGKHIHGANHTHHWKLQIKQCHNGFCAWNMLVGVMKISGTNSKVHHRNSHFTANAHGYAFVGNLAQLTTSHDCDRIYAVPFVKIGDIIDIFLDLAKYTLSYKINNIGYGVAYDNVQRTKYCLAVSLCGNNNQLQMLKYDHEQYN